MKKTLILLGLAIVFTIKVNCQYIDSLSLFITKFQKVVFATTDSLYEFTRFVEPNGKFYFKKGFTDAYSNEESILMRVRNNEFIGDYKLIFEHDTSIIDTIKSYFPINHNGYIEHSSINIMDEVTCSYVLKSLGETQMDEGQNLLRIVYPCNELNNSKDYQVVKIRLNINSTEIISICGRSVNHNGIQNVRSDSCILRKKDARNLRKHLDKVRDISNTECRHPGNPWILEYSEASNYKYYIISNYCLHENKKKFKPIALLCYNIMGINHKYFSSDCPAN